MQIGKQGDRLTITLEGAREAKLMRWLLERANYMDTAPGDQEAIVAFGAKLLEQFTAQSS